MGFGQLSGLPPSSNTRSAPLLPKPIHGSDRGKRLRENMPANLCWRPIHRLGLHGWAKMIRLGRGRSDDRSTRKSRLYPTPISIIHSNGYLTFLRWSEAVCLTCLTSYAVCASTSVLERQALRKDACEAQDRRQTHDLLQGLKLVAGNDDLITRNEIGVVGSFAFVDGRDVHCDW